MEVIMSKLLKKAIALILVLILVSANLVILGEYTIALALSDEELNEQNFRHSWKEGSFHFGCLYYRSAGF